ncbi:glycosyltransferase family 8 protein [Bacteroides xylanisolvens]|jgi:lipopolysaccharide biosynthesis glycosyltransferase|uniref:glycosyltransferase family 8 protein n=1 Tax=Bacteroides xylanisolvens TaxID=371601 RepID=UPI00374F9D48
MKNIICGIDDQYYQHCGAMLVSLFESNADEITVYVLSLELSRKSKNLLKELVDSYQKQIYFIDIPSELVLDLPMKSTDYPSLATYLRLFIPRLLPLEVEKALYVDSDIIFKKNISLLYDSDITNCALAGMEDAPNKNALRLDFPESDLYFNAGFILLNIKYLRDIDFTSMAMSYIKDHREKILLHDQDILNALLHGKVLFLPIQWNMLDCFYKQPPFIAEKYMDELQRNLDSPAVIHFSGPLKPWHHGCPHPLRKEYFKYSKKLSWGCQKPDYRYVFSAFKFPISLFIWLGCTLEKAERLDRKIRFKKRR